MASDNTKEGAKYVSFPSKMKQIGICAAISILDLATGVNFGFTAIILPSLTNSNSPDYMNTKEVSVYVSMLYIGGLAGSIICSYLLVKFGHKITMILAIPITTIGWSFSYFFNVYWLHIISRFLNGIYNSIAIGCTITYIAEITHPSLRGRLLALTDIARQFGLFFVFLVGSSSLSWRNVGVVCGLLPLIIPLVVIFFVPNSPRWMAVKGRPDQQIMDSLKFYRGEGCDVKSEFEQIQEDVQKSNNKLTLIQQAKFLKDKSVLKIFLLLVYINTLVPFIGNGAIINYYATIFETATDAINPYMSTVICGAVRLIGVFVYARLADYFERRDILIVYVSLSGANSIALGIYFYLKEINVDVSTVFWLPLVAIVLMSLSTGFIYPIIRTFRSELMPNFVRTLAVNMFMFVISVSNYTASFAYPFMAEGIGNGWTFWIYAFASMLIVIPVYLFIPQTKGKSLEEIAKTFK